MMPPPPATTKGRTGRGQLLLFVALLFGIVGMHTLGHPTGHAMEHATGQAPAAAVHAAQMPVSESASVSAPMTTSMPASMPAPMPMQMSTLMPALMSAERTQAVADEHPSPGDSGMDPLGVCLAVLGSFTLLLLTAAVLRPLLGTDLPGRAALRGTALAQRPNPPPPRATLSRLSVLRI
ncbi:hypothetical protein ACIBUY_20975 [Streptomyces sp. NPDC050085]|uniref:hypothetical protein n=1 Tax=Streptomyces sp. NPDC050085 TaxID=3365600 RepID=UPI0037A42A59